MVSVLWSGASSNTCCAVLTLYADASWLLAAALKKRDHPGTSLVLSVRTLNVCAKTHYWVGLEVVAVDVDVGMVAVAGSGINIGVLDLIDVEYSSLSLLLLLLYWLWRCYYCYYFVFDYIPASSLLTLLSRKEEVFLVTCELHYVYIYSTSVQAFEPFLDMRHQCGVPYFDMPRPRCCEMADRYNLANRISKRSVDNF